MSDADARDGVLYRAVPDFVCPAETDGTQMHEMEWLLDESELAAFFGSRGNRIQEFQKRFQNVKVSIDRKEQVPPNRLESGGTAPCKVTPVILRGVITPVLPNKRPCEG